MAKLTADQNRRLAIVMHAANLAMREGTPAARRDANTVATALGVGRPFSDRVDALHWKALATARRRLESPTSTAEAEEYGLRASEHVLSRAYQGVGWARVRNDEVDVEKVAKAINKVFASTVQNRWGTEDTLIRVVRAAYRALGGTAAHAQKFLRERERANDE